MTSELGHALERFRSVMPGASGVVLASWRGVVAHDLARDGEADEVARDGLLAIAASAGCSALVDAACGSVLLVLVDEQTLFPEPPAAPA